jgi:hypothetical protein
MSYKRRNPGKREREAGKRHRRAVVYSNRTEWEPLKLGREHLRRWTVRSMCVADSRKQEAKTAEELPRQPGGFESRSPK